MPVYSYQCMSCGLRFERRASMSERAKQNCDCGQPAQQSVPDDLSFNFNQPTSGIMPQNTGIAAIDASFDRVVAQDAAQKWAAIEQRNASKRAVLRENPNATKADLGRNPDGTYKVMNPEDRRRSEIGRTIDAIATKTLMSQKAAKPDAS